MFDILKHKRTVVLLLSALVLFYSGAYTQEVANIGDSPMSDKILEGIVRAPDFPTHVEWLNTDHPFSINDFKGKIVLLDFWTFCCINCMHVIPDLKKLEEKYAEELVVIGVHSAKFTNEKGTEAIRQAILRYGITHPVINDRDFEVWQSFGARAWPTFVLINPRGYIIGAHSGEGIYEPFDQIIGRAVDYFDSTGELRRSPLELTLEKSDMPKTLLSFPGKVKADKKGNRLIITDSNHNRILISDPGGKILEVIGSGKQGSADGDFENAEFKHPQGTYLDGDLLYIADTENHLIRSANLTTREVKTILGTGLQAHVYNIAGTGTQVALNSPWDLLVTDNKLYIAMAGSHQLWVADLKNLEAKPFAGSAREGRADGSLSEAALAQPSGITTDGKRLYFADSETSSIRFADYDSDGVVKTIIGKDLFEYGDVDGSSDVARLQHPLGLVFKDGKLYVADTYNSKIKIIDPEKGTSFTLAGTGESGLTDCKFDTAQFYEPSGITALGEKLYVADANNHVIRILDLNTKMVSTLNLNGLDMLANREMDHFSGRIINLPEQELVDGTSTLELTFKLPDGYKFTKDAPFYVTWKSGNDKALQFEVAPDEFDFSKIIFPLCVPLSAANGKSDVTVDAVIYFCKESSTTCLFDNVRINLPVVINEQGNDRLKVNIMAQTGLSPN